MENVVIRITGNEVTKTFTDVNGKEYTEKWISCSNHMVLVGGESITSQLIKDGYDRDESLIKALKSDNIFRICGLLWELK